MVGDIALLSKHSLQQDAAKNSWDCSPFSLRLTQVSRCVRVWTYLLLLSRIIYDETFCSRNLSVQMAMTMRVGSPAGGPAKCPGHLSATRLFAPTLAHRQFITWSILKSDLRTRSSHVSGTLPRFYISAARKMRHAHTRCLPTCARQHVTLLCHEGRKNGAAWPRQCQPQTTLEPTSGQHNTCRAAIALPCIAMTMQHMLPLHGQQHAAAQQLHTLRKSPLFSPRTWPRMCHTASSMLRGALSQSHPMNQLLLTRTYTWGLGDCTTTRQDRRAAFVQKKRMPLALP